MNGNFFKTNWFALAMGILLLLAILRKKPNLNPFHSSGAPAQTEKITEARISRKGGASLLGFGEESSKEAIAPSGRNENANTKAFLKRFTSVAISEGKKFGIPPAVILACACVNSQAGQRDMASSANNFFALPCGTEWEGENAQSEGKCIRKYETPWASFRDFSIHLSSQEWFGSLKKSAGKDCQKWIEKLSSEGISNGKEMREVVEANGLFD